MTELRANVLLRNLNLIDGNGNRLGTGDIRIVGGNIAAIGPHLSADAGEGVLDLSGKTALPGYFNVHTHLWIDCSPDPDYEKAKASIPEMAIRMAQRAERALLAGVTTVREAGTPHRVDIATKKMIDEGVIRGPFMHAPGLYPCITGGHGHHIAGHEADGPDEFRKAVREELKAGASVIKLIGTGGIVTKGTDPGAAQMTEEEIRVCVEEAHKAGRKVMIHAEGAEGILNAVRAGVDSIEHGFWLTDEIIDLMLEKGTYFVPTLAADALLYEHGVEAGVPQFQVDKIARLLDDRYDSFQRAVKAGVKMACGTDAGTAFNPAENTPAEFEYMVKHGTTNEQALATIGNSAELMGLDDRGYLRVGMLADIVILGGDPLIDISNTWKVEMVFKAGEQVRYGRYHGAPTVSILAPFNSGIHT